MPIEREIRETPANEPYYFTTQEVAETLRTHPETIRRHIRAGHIRVTRLGGIIRICESELKRLRGR